MLFFHVSLQGSHFIINTEPHPTFAAPVCAQPSVDQRQAMGDYASNQVTMMPHHGKKRRMT